MLKAATKNKVRKVLCKQKKLVKGIQDKDHEEAVFRWHVQQCAYVLKVNVSVEINTAVS